MPKFKAFSKLSARHKRNILHGKNNFLSKPRQQENEDEDRSKVARKYENVEEKVNLFDSQQLADKENVEEKATIFDIQQLTVNENERMTQENSSSTATINLEDSTQSHDNVDNHVLLYNNQANEQSLNDTIGETIKGYERTLQSDLANWAIRHNIKHDDLTELLHILNFHIDRNFPNQHLPNCAKVLLKTPRKTEVFDMFPGHYCHFNLKFTIFEYLQTHQDIRHMDLQVGIDGMPIFVSAVKAFWPIMGRILNDKHVFLIGCYFGEGKPDTNDFLSKFVKDISKLVEDGIEYEGSKITILLKSLICDTPAKSFVTCTKGHTGYFCCMKCTVEGERKSNSNKLCFPDLDCPLRSDKDYHKEVDIDQFNIESYHQLKRSVLLDIPKFGFVTNIPLDYMHLVLVGVTKKLIVLWYEKGSIRSKTRFLAGPQEKITRRYISNILFHIPTEFPRKPRPIKDLKHWKATNFRLFLLYTGVPILLTVLDHDDEYSIHFTSFHVALRLLCSEITNPEILEYVNNLLRSFVHKFGQYYSEENISYNVHCLIHIVQDVILHGPLDSFSAFIFENFLGQLKKRIRKAEKPLQQLIKRYGEMKNLKINTFHSDHDLRTIKMFKKYYRLKRYNGHSINPRYEKLKIKGFTYSSSIKDRYCIMNSGEIVQINEFGTLSKEIKIVGQAFSTVGNLYTEPCLSSAVGVFKVSNLSSQAKLWSIDEIHKKLMMLPFSNDNEYFVAITILHT